MTPTLRLLAAVALLGSLFGCAGWSPSMPADSLQDPAIYSAQPANG